MQFIVKLISNDPGELVLIPTIIFSDLSLLLFLTFIIYVIKFKHLPLTLYAFPPAFAFALVKDSSLPLSDQKSTIANS